MTGIVGTTGHRPDKLGGYGLSNHQRLIKLATGYLEQRRPAAISSGMALGWDQAWATAGIKLGIPVHAIIPFDGQQAEWPEAAQRKYLAILAKCADVVYVCTPGYTAGKMKRRNEWIVDHCDEMTSLWDGSEGGTRSCIYYAEAVGRKVLNLWDQWLRMRDE